MELSSSQYSTAAQCLKRYEYAYVDKIVPKPSRIRGSLRRGTWLHRALEIYHLGGDWQAALLELYDWVIEHGVDPNAGMGLHDECVEIMRGYISHWEKHGESWQVVAAEPSLKTTLQGHTLTARLDKLMRTPSGIWIVEHKSTVEIPSAQWRCIDPQTAIQWLVCYANGIKVEGIIFNYLLTKTPPIPRWKKNGEPYATTADAVTTTRAFNQGVFEQFGSDAPDFHVPGLAELRARIVHDGAYYQRYYVFRPMETILEAMKDIASTIRDLEAARQAQHYRRLSNVFYCPRFCPYSHLCAVEQVTSKRSEEIRKADFVLDDGVISREGIRR